jgi:hypothetical protein
MNFQTIYCNLKYITRNTKKPKRLQKKEAAQYFETASSSAL